MERGAPPTISRTIYGWVEVSGSAEWYLGLQAGKEKAQSSVTRCLRVKRGKLRSDAAPVHQFLQAFAFNLLEAADQVTRVLKFMNIGPDFGLQLLVVCGGFTTSRAHGVQLHRDLGLGQFGQLDENDAHVLYFIIVADFLLVT